MPDNTRMTDDLPLSKLRFVLRDFHHFSIYFPPKIAAQPTRNHLVIPRHQVCTLRTPFGACKSPLCSNCFSKWRPWSASGSPAHVPMEYRVCWESCWNPPTNQHQSPPISRSVCSGSLMRIKIVGWTKDDQSRPVNECRSPVGSTQALQKCSSLHCCSWRFPKMGVPPNHGILLCEPSILSGPIYGKPHICNAR